MSKAKKQPQKKNPRQASNANFQYEELAKFFNFGSACLAQGKLDDAEASYRKVLELKPDFAEAHNNLGIVLQEQGILDAAAKSYTKALTLKPSYVDAHNNLGLVSEKQGNLTVAIKSYQKAIVLNPNYANAHYNLGNVLRKQSKLQAALECYQQAYLLTPTDAEVIDMLFYTQLYCCDWTAYTKNIEKIHNAIRSGTPGFNPFSFVVTSPLIAEQQQCAKIFARKYPLASVPLWTGQRYQHNKIRVAYLSADFHNHATAYLIAELFELHDKNRFEITAISFGRNTEGEMRERLLGSFDRFIDVQNMSNYEVAKLLQELETDIAVDLKGYTQGGRPGILAYRPAPVQVNYLGYPGTMGVEYIDYILADRYIIPPEHQTYYTEKVAYLPDSYQVNDSKRIIAEHIPTRTEVGLPETGFVFCCFNNNYKITPEVFASWMRLLTKVKGSVLWLLGDNSEASVNLKKAAELHGISAERLIFAPRMQLSEHLARQKLADLFLDTLPCNAHTTASDALWAGLPVLTCLGNTFAGRVAASLVNAVGLPELITHNLKEYEALAFKLATTPALLTKTRDKLAHNRTSYPLFNTDRFCRHIEAAYITMWERQQHGESPVSFAVPPIA